MASVMSFARSGFAAIASPVLVSIGDVSVREGNQGAALAVFPIRLSGPTPEPVTINIAVRDGTAQAGLDYDLLTPALVVQPGFTNAFLRVAIRGDTLVEADETFLVQLTNVVNARVELGLATGTIINDDMLQLSATGASVAEGDTGLKDLVFAVGVTPGSTDLVQVDYTTADGNGVAGRDYLSRSGTLVFAPGVFSKTVRVPIIGNSTAEADKTLFLVLRNPVNAILWANEARGTILNDDAESVPEITSISLSATAVHVGVHTSRGRFCQVERSETLHPGDWIAVGNPVDGTGGTVEVADEPTASQRFYRLKLLPP